MAYPSCAFASSAASSKPIFEEIATCGIAAIIGLSARATRTRLARLIDRGLVREIGTSAKDPQRKYFLAEGGLP